ncbi:MAG: TlpA disulfide reductase family protein [Pirellulaceae bacterium]
MTQETDSWGAEQQAEPASGRGATWLWYAAVCLAAGLGTLVAIQRLGPKPPGAHPWVGTQLPDVMLDPLVNAEERLPLGDLAGKVTLINFWGPWCGYCLQEFPDLLQMRKQFSENSDFQLLSISSDGAWNPNGVPGYSEDLENLAPNSHTVLARFNTELPVYVDTHGGFRQHLHRISPWGGYPTTLLVDREGRIVSVWMGVPRDPQEMPNRVSEVLEQQ